MRRENPVFTLLGSVMVLLSSNQVRPALPMILSFNFPDNSPKLRISASESCARLVLLCSHSVLRKGTEKQ